MKSSRWYMYVIPGMIIAFFGLMGISLLFGGMESASTTPEFVP